MRRYCVRARPWSVPLYVWLWRLTLLLLAIWGYTLGDAAPVGAAEQPSKGGTIVWAVHEGMPDFDIHYQGTYIAAQPIGPIYNGLLTFDMYDNEKIVGDLAERWEVAEDGKQITFALRKGVKFHDGADFTCADAKYSLEKLTDPKRATPTFVTIMENVFASASCADDFTLVLSLKKPSAVVLTLLAGAHG
jgi:peptide/nickel transport system substrate-binding protein